ncbi:hypothetical protein SCALM49S_02303 [Streptomyces californicus]
MADLTPTPDRPGLHVSKPSPNAPATGSAQPLRSLGHRHR